STFDAYTRNSLKNLLNSLNQGFSPASGQPLSDSGAGGFKSAVPELTPTLKDIAWVSQAVRGTHPGDLETLLSSASNVTGTLAGSSKQLVDLIHGLNVASSALASTDGSLAQTITGIDQTLQVAPSALATIDHALPPLVN